MSRWINHSFLSKYIQILLISSCNYTMIRVYVIDKKFCIVLDMSFNFIFDPSQAKLTDLPNIQAMRLSGAIRTKLPPQHALREPLRADALQQATRHSLIRADIRQLLAIWQEHQIPALLIKGFYLSEFEYTTNSERFYGDVDIVVPHDPIIINRACQLALAHGWRTDDLFVNLDDWKHEIGHLYSPSGHTRIDLHRFVVAYPTGGASLKQAEDITSNFWQRSRIVDWQGIKVNIPNPKDAVIINLMLARLLGDLARLKPADYFDFVQLLKNNQLTLNGLEQHATKLGLLSVWREYLKYCSPLHQNFCLDSNVTQIALCKIMRSIGFNGELARLRFFGKFFIDNFNILPLVLYDILVSMWAIKKGGDPRKYLQDWDKQLKPNLQRRISYTHVTKIILAINWMVKKLHPKQKLKGTCLPRAYASYRALTRLGHPVVFINGVAKGQNSILSHAWIEDDRGAIESYGEPFNRDNYTVLFEHTA